MYKDDFTEVGHTGGKATFKIKCDSEGNTAFSVGYSHSSPRPATLVGIYAHPDRFAVGNIMMGGIGQHWSPPPLPNCIPVIMASDSEGKFGHECPSCNQHFRTSSIPADSSLICPYCGLRTESYHFLTSPQKDYISHYVETLNNAIHSVNVGASTDVEIDMDEIADSVSQEPRPDFYYTSTTQQTQFKCSSCGSFNDVRGRFAYCATCGYRNNLDSVSTTFKNIRQRLNDEHISPSDAVKQAISEFDAFGRDFVMQLIAQVPMKKNRRNQLQKLLFHNIDKIDELMQSVFGINLLSGMDNDRTFIRKMFYRRHVYEHDGGVATDRYVSESGDSEIHEGTLIRETAENAHKLIGCLNKMANTLDADFHEIIGTE